MTAQEQYNRSLQQHLDDALQRLELPGAAAMVYRDGQMQAASSGWVEEGIPYSTDTLIRVGCLAKVFTACQVMLLSEAGLLKLDDPIGLLSDCFASDTFPILRKVTVRQLLTHQSGLIPNLFIRGGRPDTRTVLEFMTQRSEDELFVAQPGEACSYSTLGYVILNRLIEDLRQTDWSQDLDQRLLQPIGMPCQQMPAEKKQFAPLGVSFFDDTPATSAPEHLAPADGGAMAFSARDLMTLALFHLNRGKTTEGQQLLSVQSIEQMYGCYGVPSGPWPNTKGLGFGWILYADGSIGFTGDGGRNHVLIRLCPTRCIALTIVANYHTATPLFEHMWRAVAGQADKPAAQPPEEQKDASDAMISGRYYDGVQQYTVEWDGSKGAMQVENLDPYNLQSCQSELVHMGGNHYVAPELGKFINYWFLNRHDPQRSSHMWNGVMLIKRR